jgi:hypothetical protein
VTTECPDPERPGALAQPDPAARAARRRAFDRALHKRIAARLPPDGLAPFAAKPSRPPGMSTPLGIAIAVLAVRQALGKPPHLPKRIGGRQLRPKTRRAILGGGLKFLRFLEKGIRPRRTSWMSWRAVQMANCLVIVWMGFLLALPLAIPFTNTTPAYAIIFVAASMMEEDGVMIWMGYAASLGTTIYFAFCAELIVHHFGQWLQTLTDWLRLSA